MIYYDLSCINIHVVRGNLRNSFRDWKAAHAPAIRDRRFSVIRYAQWQQKHGCCPQITNIPGSPIIVAEVSAEGS